MYLSWFDEWFYNYLNGLKILGLFGIFGGQETKNIMDITRLRICTWKSIADFYQKCNWTVAKLYEDRPSELLKAYYGLEKISFNEDVLIVLKERFPNFFEIEKPGKLKEWRSIVFEDYSKSWTEKTRPELLKTMRWYGIRNIPIPDGLNRAYIAAKSVEMPDKDRKDLNLSKKELMARNHGRK